MRFVKSTLGAAAVALSFGTVAAAQTTIFYGHSGPARGTVPAALKWFDGRIGELSDGDLKLDVQWGGALFKASASVQSIGDGVADAGSIISAYFQKEMAAYSLADLPLGGPNPWVGLRATDHLMRSMPEITENLARQNLVYIGTFTASDVNVACKGAEINSIKDIAGMKVRGAGVYGKVFGELGATMVNLSVYEAYQGLDTGLIDCTQGYSYIIPALKWHEVIDSYTVLNWGQIGGYGMFMNKQSYDALSDDQKAVLTQAGTELADKFAQIVIGANAKALNAMREGQYERPVKVIEVSAEEQAELNAATEPFLADWKENAASVGLNPDAMIEVYTQAVADYTAEFEAKGYPWERN
jgi:TRAP-type C4-dicarboxylate transport system substrate-binding protein